MGQLRERTIVHQVDLENLRGGGIDTCISDMVKYCPAGWDLRVVGVATAGQELGVWRQVDVSGRTVSVMNIARVAKHGRSTRLPDSVKLAIGVLRFRRKMRSNEFQVHRVEINAVVRVVFRKARVIQFLHGDGIAGLGRTSDSAWRFFPKLAARLEKAAVSHASEVHIFSRRGGERLLAVRSDVHVWRTWYDPALFFCEDQKDRSGIVWIGRLETPKDPVLALRVFAELLRRRPGLSIAMVGDGQLKHDCRRIIRELGLDDRLQTVDHLKRERLAELLRRSKVMLMTSYFEGSPRVLIEAAASGTAIVATTESDPDDALAEMTNGWRVIGRNPADLADAVLEACEAPNATNDAAAVWSAPAVIESILSC